MFLFGVLLASFFRFAALPPNTLRQCNYASVVIDRH